jgi:hypothetical protein
MLSNWSSPFPHEETQMNMLKKKARPKLVSARQLEQQDDDELHDYIPKIEKPKRERQIEKDDKEEKIQKENFKEMYENPFSEKEQDHSEYPIYDKPFEYTPTYSKDAQLLEKLNYMIYLLEEQKDEKTGQVTEELILYVFLGVFVLFVLDSFFKTGKYSR